MTTLACPVRSCHLLLAREERRYVCANGHSFDIARSGYVNLLGPQDRRSKTPGDSAAAVAARRRFLDRGHAAPLVEGIVRSLPMREGAAFLDAGCGEGHHLAAFRDAYHIDGCGVDISIPAIDLAARRYHGCLWIVANADRVLPFADGAFEAVATITARLNPTEFRRLLQPGGRLLVVIPGADDLIELRELAQGEGVERDRTDRTVALFSPHFSLVAQEHLTHRVRLGREDIADVMESSYRGLRTRERDRLATIGSAEVTLSRDVMVFAAQ